MMNRTAIPLLFMFLVLTVTTSVCAQTTASNTYGQPVKKTRVEFDDMLVRGQTKKADAVYVFDRGQFAQKDLTTPRQDYRKEITETMFR
jgi:hypothetical protein